MANKTTKSIDVDKPNLYRDVFPYTEFPKVLFDGKTVPYDLPEDVLITDTTFRDGQQARPPYTPEQILRIYDLLHKIDGGTGLIRQCEFFLYSKRDRKAVELCKARGYKFPEITGWIRAVEADFDKILLSGELEDGVKDELYCPHCGVMFKKLVNCSCKPDADMVIIGLTPELNFNNAISFCNVTGCINGTSINSGDVIRHMRLWGAM